MKLFLAAVAALAMVGCADQVETTQGGNMAGIRPAKPSPDSPTPAVSGTKQFEGMEGAWYLSVDDIAYSGQAGTFSEEMSGFDNGGDDLCGADCEVIAIHTSDGKYDNIEMVTLDGTHLCSIRRTETRVLENSCTWVR